MSKPILLQPIGQIRTPWKTLADCPSGPGRVEAEARLEILPEYAEGLHALASAELDLLYWFDRAPRDVLRSVSPHDGVERGVFAMRSPHRPNPVALSRVPLIAVEGNTLVVGALDCLDGTALFDIKPVPGGGGAKAPVSS
ncbi:tRNA-Thr(GGU) m(6)t(6)A37 methyltransferase TsaA [Paracoccus halophilus]|uniref:tRNA-Thr(GGU) m(6)t(6)A37 methyltransferase TsaA n=1 Tax=Paracoccus halophilus TaxID=376733 RepID=A0A1I0SVX2_9RHOB|nr:tRNA (N6-threonylcarbamoyladenosine(37)-N6)-methyltransferase TrmO [Paracoccus halophilus]SFA43644.1 tRNA-Thr(GGU) m(6)t(6)A37 methyltransferase TsaA [Paracoccus halophilus]